MGQGEHRARGPHARHRTFRLAGERTPSQGRAQEVAERARRATLGQARQISGSDEFVKWHIPFFLKAFGQTIEDMQICYPALVDPLAEVTEGLCIALRRGWYSRHVPGPSAVDCQFFLK